MGLVNTAMTIVTGLTIDRFGRRTLLITGSLIAAVSLMILSSLFHVGIHDSWQKTAMLLSMITYIIGYCISVGSLFWLIISEIFPLSVRGQAMSIATAIQWLANFLVSVSFLSLLNAVGTSITFSLYSLVCCIAVVFVYFWIPETKQLSLEEIEMMHLKIHNHKYKTTIKNTREHIDNIVKSAVNSANNQAES
jgi:MFS family permease